MTGTIIKGIAGFYYVDVVGSGIYECKAKGIFRKDRIKPLVGDIVEIKVLDETEKEANIEKILPRRSEIYRPAVANTDQVIAVMALADPTPNFGVLDRLLVQMSRQGIPALICFNKSDLVEADDAEKIRKIYSDSGYTVLLCSTYTHTGLARLKEILKDKTTVLAGPSGVGKSSLINCLSMENMMETGEISRKLKRGRHTTRHSQLIILEPGTYICDTPGFTSFSAENMPKEELKSYFPEFKKYEDLCRFGGCVHVNEPECKVKDAVSSGEIPKERYESYLKLYQELKEAERRGKK